MAAYLEQRRTEAAGWSRRLAVFSAALFVTAGIAHRVGSLETMAFLWTLVIVATLAVGALFLALYAFSRLWAFGDLGGGDLAIGGLIALAVLTPFLVSAYRAAIYPRLNDISTDFDIPPALAAGSRAEAMNSIGNFTLQQRLLQMENYPLVAGRRYDLPFDRVVEAVNTVIARQGWAWAGPRPAAVTQAEMTIEARAETFLLGFPVDIAVRLTDEGGATYVDMRSASRFGDHDLGDNARRIVAFLAELDVEIASLAGLASPE
ncbi:MAG: DUF1499 domain-containing protein [Pseudaminobacter sp.]|nr:DUF1499 domain-containing protein [Pseudaminobacter sp.]